MSVVPTDVIEGTTVVPLIVGMQVFWQFSAWLLQPPRQVADVELVLGTGVVGVVVSGVPAVGAVVSCAIAVLAVKPMVQTSAATTKRNARASAKFLSKRNAGMATHSQGAPRFRHECMSAKLASWAKVQLPDA